MEIVLLMLWSALRKRRARTYTSEQLAAIARDAALRDAAAGVPPQLEPPRKVYRWWKYAGLV